jgi:hypothetical protein
MRPARYDTALDRGQAVVSALGSSVTAQTEPSARVQRRAGCGAGIETAATAVTPRQTYGQEPSAAGAPMTNSGSLPGKLP